MRQRFGQRPLGYAPSKARRGSTLPILIAIGRNGLAHQLVSEVFIKPSLGHGISSSGMRPKEVITAFEFDEPEFRI